MTGSDEYADALAHIKGRWPAHAIVLLGVVVVVSMAIESSQQTQGAMLAAGVVGAGIASEMMLAIRRIWG